MFTFVALALAVLPALVQADAIPATPPTGNEGGKCTITWTPDTTGTWKKMNIELMTGPNAPMVHLKTVATLDGTSTTVTSFTYDCPQVEPNSAIYFYQLSSPVAPSSLQWTTRFAIADATGKTVPPPNATQPDGQAIGWGTGRLVNAAEADPLPAYLNGNGETSQAQGGAAPPAGGASSVVPSASVPLSSAAAPSVPVSSTVQSASVPVSTPSGMASVPVSKPSSSASASSSASSASASNAAVSGKSSSMLVFAGVAALGGYVANW